MVRPSARFLILGLTLHLLGFGAPGAFGEVNYDELAQSAIQCSGIFYIMTASEDAYTSILMTDLTEMMGFIFSAYKTHDTEDTLSNGEIFANRDRAVEELSALYDSNAAVLVDIYKRCFAWSQEISGYLQGIPEADRTRGIKPVLLSAPTLPAPPKISREERERAQRLIGDAFRRWTEVGKRRLPSDIQNQLMREVERNMEKNPHRR